MKNIASTNYFPLQGGIGAAMGKSSADGGAMSDQPFNFYRRHPCCNSSHRRPDA